MQPCNKLITALQSCSNLSTTKLQPYKLAAILDFAVWEGIENNVISILYYCICCEVVHSNHVMYDYGIAL